VADNILELREAKGDLELDVLNQVPYLRITQSLLDCLDLTSFENKDGMGSLYDRHRERVRSVDKLIGKWDGTGQGQVKGRVKDMASSDKVPLIGGKSYYNKQEGDWWICTFGIYARSRSSLLESQSKSSRRVRRTDGGGYCPGADVYVTPPGVCLSMKVLSISL
jgi:hypothetical protein